MTAPLLDTPRTVQVVPQQVIQDQAATNLQDVLRNSPGEVATKTSIPPIDENVTVGDDR